MTRRWMPAGENGRDGLRWAVSADPAPRRRIVRNRVWLGHDDDLDVPVAVKVLADNWANNSDVRSRFLAEARIMRRIRDRRLVQVYDIGTLDDGRPYFVMDYVDGGSLNDLRQALVLVRSIALHLSGPCCAGTLCRLNVHHDSRAALNWSLRSPLNSFRTTPIRSEVSTASSATTAMDPSTKPKVRARFPPG
jgi:serine/threonine protein kinase